MSRDTTEITIRITTNDRADRWFCSLVGADLSGGWCESVDAALIMLMEKCREKRRELSNRPSGDMDQDDWTFYKWLVKLTVTG